MLQSMESQSRLSGYITTTANSCYIQQLEKKKIPHTVTKILLAATVVHCYSPAPSTVLVIIVTPKIFGNE